MQKPQRLLIIPLQNLLRCTIDVGKGQRQSRLWTVCRNLNWISLWFQTCWVIHNSSQAHLQLTEEHSGTSLFSTGRERWVLGLLSEGRAVQRGRGARISTYTCTCGRTLQISTCLWPRRPLQASTDWNKSESGEGTSSTFILVKVQVKSRREPWLP